MEAYKMSFMYPGNEGIIGRKDYKDLLNTTYKTFKEICPPDFIKREVKAPTHVIELINGSTIHFMGLKDPQGLGSYNLGWFFIDEAEEVEEQIFTRLIGRLSRADVNRPVGWLTTNPPNEDHWIYKTFEVQNKTNPEYFTIHASTYEMRDVLAEGYIESLQTLPPSWQKKYLEGHYGFTPDGTPWYRGYRENMHRRALEFNPALPLLCGWDSGKRHPAFVVTQYDAPRWKILAEILGSDITIDRFVDEEVLPLLNDKFPNTNRIHYAGPEFNMGNDKSDFTSNEILRDKGIQLNIMHSEYSLRKTLIEQKINNITDGMPCLQVDTSCRIINDAFLGGYRYPKRRPDQAFNIHHELPFRDGFYEHLANALEYIAVQVFKPFDQSDHSNQFRRQVHEMERQNNAGVEF
jgi:hypothetical protein